MHLSNRVDSLRYGQGHMKVSLNTQKVHEKALLLQRCNDFTVASMAAGTAKISTKAAKITQKTISVWFQELIKNYRISVQIPGSEGRTRQKRYGAFVPVT